MDSYPFSDKCIAAGTNSTVWLAYNMPMVYVKCDFEAAKSRMLSLLYNSRFLNSGTDQHKKRKFEQEIVR